jgi:HEAT repeat protein
VQPAANPNPFGNNNSKGPAKANNPFKAPDNPFKAPPVAPRDDPYAQPTSIDKALAMLRDEDIRRRQIAADWLNNRAPDPTRQKEVGQALEPLLDDGQTREQGARALGKWATKDNVPALIKVLDAEGGNAWRPAIEALTRLKDERSASVLAAQLPNFFRKEDAGRALQALGPVAEKEVVKFIHHKDFGARQKASQLLKGYNTKDDVLIAQHVTDLGSTEPETKRLAAEDLAKVKLDPTRQAEVARALDPLLVDIDRRMHEAAVNALAIWAIKDNAVGLLKVMDDLGLHDKALLILIQLKDARTLPALAVRLLTPQREKIARAMLQIGPPAAVEQAVLRAEFLGNTDRNVRKQVIAILALVGSKNSIKPLQAVGQTALAQQDRAMYTDCVVAIKAIQARGGKKPGL